MADHRSQFCILLLAIFHCTVALSNIDGVPVMLWGNKIQSYPDALVGHSLSQDAFKSEYLKKLADQNNHNIVAFIQDHLSIEDITHNADVYDEDGQGGVLHNLKNAMESYESTHLSSVKKAGDLVEELGKKFDGKLHHLQEPYNVKDLPLAEGRNLVLVHLPKSGKGSGEMEKALSKTDKIIGMIGSQLKEMKTPFTALYTAKESSRKTQQEPHHGGRSLMAATEYTFINVSNCIYLYAKDITFEVFQEDGKPSRTANKLPPLSAADSSSTCANGTAKLVVKYTSAQLGNGTTDLSFNMEFKEKNGMWSVSKFTMSYSGKNGSVEYKATDAPVDAASLTAPTGFSYSCSEPAPFTQQLNGTDSKTADLARLRFTNFQIQFGAIKNDKFGYSNDCIGFFTIPIWSGIIVGLLLAAILAGGIAMIANIKTMDRFDDPKGKTITVTATE